MESPLARPGDPDPAIVADRIHAAAIRLLRYVRREDVASGLSAPQLSVLSVLVFQGPQRMSDLAAIEQVRPPTMSKLVADLARRGLVERGSDESDRRISRISASRKGRALLEEGRRRRLARLVAALTRLKSAQLAGLSAAADALLEITRSDPS
jgi:DNA-binding MarR family transcriptional regulator